MAALASALIAGQATTAFAFKNDTNNGPGSGKSTEVSLQAPGDNSDSSQSSGNNTSPTTIVEESSQSTDTSQSETSQTTETTTETTTDTTTAAETVTEDTSAQVPTNQAFLQVQLLRASDQVWSDPVRDDSVLSVGDAGFLSMCIYANNLPGDVLYRTYSSSRGWTNWAMNGGHTDWSADCPVEAVQIRLNGIFGDRFDVYYRSNLSDGTECDWSKNGGTNGAMACGRIITGMRFSMWGKGVDGAAYKMDNPLVSAAPDGIQFVNGTPVFSNGTGDNFTGWVWNDRDRYYVVDNAIVTGWQYIDGYKYYFEGDGKLVTDLEPYLNYQGQFKIKINKQMNCLTIYIPDGDNGYIIPYKSFLCSTGDDTPLGEHKTPEKYRWRLMNTDEYCQYLTRLDAGIPILLHSVIYERPDPYTLKAFTYNYLGATKSHGCIRLTTADSRWIYEHCALGTSITVYESPIPGPFDRPVIKTMIPDTQTYDPTDANVPENGLQLYLLAVDNNRSCMYIKIPPEADEHYVICTGRYFLYRKPLYQITPPQFYFSCTSLPLKCSISISKICTALPAIAISSSTICSFG